MTRALILAFLLAASPAYAEDECGLGDLTPYFGKAPKSVAFIPDESLESGGRRVLWEAVRSWNKTCRGSIPKLRYNLRAYDSWTVIFDPDPPEGICAATIPNRRVVVVAATPDGTDLLCTEHTQKHRDVLTTIQHEIGHAALRLGHSDSPACSGRIMAVGELTEPRKLTKADCPAP